MRTFLMCLLFAVFVQAQDQDSSLDLLRTTYDVQMTELELPLAEWHQKYLGELKALQAKVQQAGDLEQLIVIREEIEGTAPVIDPKHTALKRLRAIYDQRNASLEKSIAGKRRQVMAAYHKQLTELQAKLTQAGAIDEALKVREEVTQLEILAKANIPAQRRPRRVRTPGANRRPGRLVIFGLNNETKTDMVLPEAAKGQPFVRVFANYNSFYAIDPKGGVLQYADANNDMVLVDDMEPVADASVGQYVAIMLNEDGSLTKTKSGWNKGLIPEGNDFEKIACGVTVNAALKRNGEVIPFGYSLKNKSFLKPEYLKNVADVVLTSNVYIFRHKDGTVVATHFEEDHPWRNKPKGLDGKVVAMAGGTNTSCVFLTDEGEVIGWQAGEPPTLKNAKQVRAGHHLYAAQKADNTWVCWGNEEWSAKFNEQLKVLGPLKDLALGQRFFIAIK